MNKTIQVHSSSLFEKCVDIKESKGHIQPLIHKVPTVNKRRGRKRRRRGGWQHRNRHDLKRHKWSNSFTEDNTTCEEKNTKGPAKSWYNTYHTIVAWQYQRQAEFWKKHSSDLEKQKSTLKNELECMKNVLMENSLKHKQTSHTSNEHRTVTQVQNNENDGRESVEQSCGSNKTIKLLENEIQQNFVKYVRDYKPLFWPNIPLNL